MKSEEIKACLYDILQAINEVDSYYVEVPKEFEEFKRDLRTKRAIERNLEIMGEAVGRILKMDSEFQLTNALQIIGTRNRIIHGYDSVSDEMIWSIVINHLPLLQKEIEEKLAH